MAKEDFHRFVPKMGTHRLYGMTTQSFFDAFWEERKGRRLSNVEQVLSSPFKGVTTDGDVKPGLFRLRPEGAPTAAVLDAVAALVGHLTPEQKAGAFLPLDSRDRNLWQNSISRYEQYGIRFEDVSPAIRQAGMEVLRASLSARGYEKSRNVMMLNGFLGELIGAPKLLGEWCYQLHFFGEPSATEPWGWQLSGHHLCLTCFILGEQMTLTPTFMGVEPNYADEGQYAGITVFEDEERAGLEFALNLSPDQKQKAILYDSLLPDKLPPGRHHPNDGLTLGGAYQDNCVVPYEGVSGAELDPAQRRDLLDLAECYLSTLPPNPLRARMDDVEKHMAETHFCWAGGLEETSVFYYRIQSPVVMIEFDHHHGVVLGNETPKRFHVHTIVRTPNGNDYGMDLLRLHYENAPHHQEHHRI